MTKSEDKVTPYSNSSKDAAKGANLGIKLYYAVLIGLSVIVILAAILTSCCKFFNCRYVMYFGCVVLFILGLIGFLLAVFFSVVLPPMTWSCQYFDQSLTSEANFIENFNFLIDRPTLNKISICMPFGNGDILLKIGGMATDGLSNLT